MRPATEIEFSNYYLCLGSNGIVKLRAEVLRERMVEIIAEGDNGETLKWSHCGNFTILWENPPMLDDAAQPI